MINNIVKFLMILLVLSFFILVFKYYFSTKNVSLVEFKRNNFQTQIFENISDLPVLLNDTNEVIEFNSGFSNSDQKTFKRSFWELFK